MYFNNIKKEVTKYPYRFKTEEEFKSDYGEEWYYNLSNYGSEFNWDYHMNKFLGKDLESNSKFVDDMFNNKTTLEYNDFFITNLMIKPNDNFNKIYNKKTSLVYEDLKIKEYKYKNLIVKCNSDEDLIKVQELSFKNGFHWYSNDRSKYVKIKPLSIIESQYLALDTIDKDIIDNTSNIIKYIISMGSIEESLMFIYGENTNYFDSYEEFNDYFEYNTISMYNKSKKLVYENKIIKYDKYKKGD